MAVRRRALSSYSLPVLLEAAYEFTSNDTPHIER
jgi:hypothetical protein